MYFFNVLHDLKLHSLVRFESSWRRYIYIWQYHKEFRLEICVLSRSIPVYSCLYFGISRLM